MNIPWLRNALFVGAILLFALSTLAQPPHPRAYNERFVISAMVRIHGAQETYRATAGGRNYGTLAELHSANLIDAGLAQGIRHGYLLSLQTTPATQTSSPSYVLTAVPRIYRRSGFRSFYLDPSSFLRGADRGGSVALASDPEIETCSFFESIADNERCTIYYLRWFHGAEMAYASTWGNRNYGTFAQLFGVGMIRESMADYSHRGYVYQLRLVNRVPMQSDAAFEIQATPQIYGMTGIRSFFIATDGVIRGADKNGDLANANDPPIE